MMLALLAALAVDSVTGTAPNATTPLSEITACVSPCTQTPSFTNSAGTFIVCGIVASVTTGSTVSVGSVTYGGDAMTLEQSTAYNTNAEVSALYSKLSPKTGANNLSFTVTNGGSFDRATAGCISFTGNDTTTPVVVATKFTGSSTSTTTIGGTMTSTTAGNILLMVGQGGFGSISAGPDGTVIYTGADDGGTAGGKQMMQRRAAGGSVAMTWTQGTADSEGAAGIEVAAAAAGGGSTAAPGGGFTLPDVDFIPRGGTLGRGKLAFLRTRFAFDALASEDLLDVSAAWLTPETTLICQVLDEVPMSVTVVSRDYGTAKLLVSSSLIGPADPVQIQCLGGTPQ